VVLEEVDRHVLLLIPLHHVWTQFAFAKVTHRLCDHVLVLGGGEFHRGLVFDEFQ
jgi:hypothetical protein